MMDILEFLHSFLPLINSHSNDFLIVDLWQNFLPEVIRSALNSIEDPEDILRQYIRHVDSVSAFTIDFINLEVNFHDLVDSIDGVIDRKLKPNWECVGNNLDNFIKFCASFSRFKIFKNAQSDFIDNYFIGHEMKMKKSYEVERMSSLCHKICDKYNIKNIVDVGSGKGYLGSDLSFLKGFNVVELDSKESNSEGAFKRRKRLELQLPSKRKKKNITENINEGRVQSIVKTITSVDTISLILKESGCFYDHYLLTGLHSCGGLSSTILKNFVTNSDSKAVAIVGCCYHLIGEKFVKNFPHDRIETWDFPLSSTLEKSGIILGRNAKSFASQSVRRNIDQPNMPSNMFNRILLQKLLYEKMGYVSDDWVVGKINKNNINSERFESYARIACERLGFKHIADNMSSEEFEIFENRFPHLRHQFSCFYYLKCCMSAIIENIIILDRMMFLQDNGVSSVEVLELFDEVQSPRRYALVGVK